MFKRIIAFVLAFVLLLVAAFVSNPYVFNKCKTADDFAETLQKSVDDGDFNRLLVCISRQDRLKHFSSIFCLQIGSIMGMHKDCVYELLGILFDVEMYNGKCNIRKFETMYKEDIQSTEMIIMYYTDSNGELLTAEAPLMNLEDSYYFESNLLEGFNK